jgi:drug/metabolite transporter (DMT)-like permease
MLARWQQRVGLTAVAVIGGSVPFVLFFEGLAKASSTQAQFLHKTLVIWVAVLAVSLLGERLHAAHVVAIAALVVGQAVLGGGVAAIRPGTGELLILAATLLWSVEVVLAKRLLAQLRPTTVALARMAGGAVVLVGWVVASGRLPTLVGLSPTGWLWAAATGTLLAGYVALWFTALVRVGAIDVTAVLVLAVPVTAGLNIAVKGTSLTPAGSVGLLLLATGVLIVVAAAMLRRPRKLELVG